MALLRVGLIGHGSMGRNHARVLSELDGVNLVGIVDPGAGSELASSMSMDSLISAGIDYAVVAVPTSAHEAVAVRLADAGVHALVEKPLAATVDSARRIAEAFASAGLIGAVGHVERFNPAAQLARRLLAEGHLGEVLQIATRRQGPFPTRVDDVGVVSDLASHDIDLTAWLAQTPFTSVFARTGSRGQGPHEDLVTIVGRLQSGVVTSHIVNWLSPFKERVAVITGQRGAFVIDTLHGDLTFYENGHFQTEWGGIAQLRGVSEGDIIRYATPKREPLKIEHEEMRNAVLGLPSEVVTLESGLETMRVAEAVLRSARTQELARLSEFE